MLKTILRTSRPPFLVLTPATIFLSFAMALRDGFIINYYDLALLMVGALLAHIGVNILNEYEDFKSGLDAATAKTPFSGGSGALVRDPAAAGTVLSAALLSLFACSAIGLYFVVKISLSILLIGVLGVSLILTYTRWLNRNAFLCLVAPGFAFGPLMMLGGYIVLSRQLSPGALLISLVPFFLGCNLLLLNQIPDIGADRIVGRKHFPIVFGVRTSLNLYLLFALATCLSIVTGIFLDVLPTSSYLCLIPPLLSLGVSNRIQRHAFDIADLLPALAVNALITVITPISLGLTLIFSN